MAAATFAAELGIETVPIDEQASPGGQIYRSVVHAPPNSPLGPDYLAGRDLAAALRASRVEYRPNTTLWHVDPNRWLISARTVPVPRSSRSPLAPSPISTVRRLPTLPPPPDSGPVCLWNVI